MLKQKQLEFFIDHRELIEISISEVGQLGLLELASCLIIHELLLFEFPGKIYFLKVKNKYIFRFEIPMMVGRFKIPVGYSSDLECRIAELPFSSRRVSFFIILPDDVDRGIKKIEANMSSDNIKALFSTLKVRISCRKLSG